MTRTDVFVEAVFGSSMQAVWFGTALALGILTAPAENLGDARGGAVVMP
jgi:hypothetical protein